MKRKNITKEDVLTAFTLALQYAPGVEIMSK